MGPHIPDRAPNVRPRPSFMAPARSFPMPYSSDPSLGLCDIKKDAFSYPLCWRQDDVADGDGLARREGDKTNELCSSITDQCTSWDNLHKVSTDILSILGGSVSAADADEIQHIVLLVQLLMEDTTISKSIQLRTGASALQAGLYFPQSEHLRLEPESCNI